MGVAATAAAADKADRIFVNGRVWTGDTARPRAEAVAVRGTTILAVGSTAEVRRLAEKATDIVDLKGRFLCPGFGDAHVGLMSASLALDAVDLAGALTQGEMGRRIAAYAKANPQSPWIVGRGWSYAAFPGGLPHKKALDDLVPDRPAFLVSYDGHTGWVNSPALLAAGFNRTSKDPAGGVVVRDPDGEPTGALKEEPAMAPVRRLIPGPSPDQRLRALRKGMALAVSQGLTSMHDVTLREDDIAVFEQLAAEGGFKVRVHSALPLVAGASGATTALRQAHAKAQGPKWRIGAVMGFVDGVVESRTAAFFEPYPGGGDGLLSWAEAELDPSLGDFAWRGWSFDWDAVPGEGELACRATDATGAIQPLEPPWNYQGMGNNAVQRVLVTVR
jgi:hypothetical protein